MFLKRRNLFISIIKWKKDKKNVRWSKTELLEAYDQNNDYKLQNNFLWLILYISTLVGLFNAEENFF